MFMIFVRGYSVWRNRDSYIYVINKLFLCRSHWTRKIKIICFVGFSLYFVGGAAPTLIFSFIHFVCVLNNIITTKNFVISIKLASCNQTLSTCKKNWLYISFSKLVIVFYHISIILHIIEHNLKSKVFTLLILLSMQIFISYHIPFFK